MTKLDLTKLTNEELQIEAKKRKDGYTLFKFVIGLMIGTAIFTTFKKGFGFFTLFPVFFMPLAINANKSYQETQKELKSRNI
jgi:riboflavin transporter FmnP